MHLRIPGFVVVWCGRPLFVPRDLIALGYSDTHLNLFACFMFLRGVFPVGGLGVD